MTLPIGLFATFAVIFYSMGTQNLAMYANSHSLALVVGGTFTVLLMSSPWKSLLHLWTDLWSLFKPVKSFNDFQNDLVSLVKNKNSSVKINDPLVTYAQELWLQGISQDLFVVLLSQKKNDIEQKGTLSIQCLKNLSKYPPAFGMAGTVIGVVSLFQSLDNNKDKIGASLALAMTATFLGLVLANAIVMPLADRLQIKHSQQKQLLQNIYQVLLLINQNEFNDLIYDEVQSRAAA